LKVNSLISNFTSVRLAFSLIKIILPFNKFLFTSIRLLFFNIRVGSTKYFLFFKQISLFISFIRHICLFSLLRLRLFSKDLKPSFSLLMGSK